MLLELLLRCDANTSGKTSTEQNSLVYSLHKSNGIREKVVFVCFVFNLHK